MGLILASKNNKTNIIKYVLFRPQISYPDRELIVNPSPSNPPRSEAQKIEQLEKKLQWAELKIHALEERLRLELIRKYGPKSETLNDAQLLLLELEPGVSSAEVEAESQREPLPPASSPMAKKPNKSRKHPGRQELPADLPRVERVIACTPEQCVCQVLRQGHGGDRLRAERTTGCGAGPILRGCDQAREACLPGMRGRRERGATAGPDYRKRTGERSGGDRYAGVQVLRPPAAVSAKRDSGAGDGVSISRATMDGWVMTVGGLLVPIGAAIGRELVGGRLHSSR